MNDITMADLIEWSKVQRKLMELQAAELAKTADNRSIVELALAFPFYVQEKLHAVGEIVRHPETGQLKRCVFEYDGSVQPTWTVDDGTLWYAYHGISKETAYPWVKPTGGHDTYLPGEYMTYEDGKIYRAQVKTEWDPITVPANWELVEE